MAHDGKEVGLVLVLPLESLVDLFHMRTLPLELGVGRTQLLGTINNLRFKATVQAAETTRHLVELRKERIDLA